MRPTPTPTRTGARFTVRWAPAPGETRGPVVAVAPLDWSPASTLDARLTAAEQRRYAALADGQRRREYRAGHALLHTLGREEGGTTDFRRCAYGRPELLVAGAVRAAALSHAAGLVAAGLAVRGAIGIDLEFPRSERTWQAVERRFAWPALDAGQRLLRWSLWEAAGKARGLGVFRTGPDPVFEGLWDGARGTLRSDGSAWQAWDWPLPGNGVLVVVLGGA